MRIDPDSSKNWSIDSTTIVSLVASIASTNFVLPSNIPTSNLSISRYPRKLFRIFCPRPVFS